MGDKSSSTHAAVPRQTRKDAPTRGTKLPRLPTNATVTKRPLLHPAIPSPYTGARNPKCVYVSSKTPFLGAVKRVQKLLRLAEKREMQSAVTLAKQNARHGRPGKRKRGADDEDGGILDATMATQRQRAEKQKHGDTKPEDVVVIKGTGKAIQKVMELGLWFQQRDEYLVRLQTGSVGAIDDISMEAQGEPDEQIQHAGVDESPKDARTTSADIEGDQIPPSHDRMDIDSRTKPRSGDNPVQDGGGEQDEVPETRLRYTSVLEVSVSLK